MTAVLAKSAPEIFEAEVYETEGRELEKGGFTGFRWQQLAPDSWSSGERVSKWFIVG